MNSSLERFLNKLEELPDFVKSTDTAIQSVCESPAIYFPCQHCDEQTAPISKTRCHFYPHWEMSSVVYHVCFRLVDSIPREQLEKWLVARKHYLDVLRVEKRPYLPEEIAKMQYLYSENIEKYLDAGYGECILANPEIAAMVENALKYFNGTRYSLHAWCIMPNHVHVLFQLLENYRFSEVIKNWKSFTAHKINRILNRSGSIWQIDYYNHIIRSEAEYFKQVRYVWNNPIKARLGATWPWRWKIIE